jgi:hypothetical protein
VRLRAAEALVDIKAEMVPIFEEVVATADRYGFHAYVAALDNAGLQGKLESELKAIPPAHQGDFLLKVLHAGTLSPRSQPPREWRPLTQLPSHDPIPGCHESHTLLLRLGLQSDLPDDAHSRAEDERPASEAAGEYQA